MNSVAVLLDQIRSGGFSLQLVNAKLRIQGPKQPEGQYLAVIDELRQRREEVKAFLTEACSKQIELPPSIQPPSLGCKCTASIYKQLRIDGDGFDWMCSRCGKTLHVPEAQPQRADVTEGQMVAVEICSEILQAHIWLAFDKSFDPKDKQAVFYADEIPLLKNKTPEQIREIHKVKLAFGPESRVRT
jgi:hypothetical protein